MSEADSDSDFGSDSSPDAVGNTTKEYLYTKPKIV